jgi:hypothetical protein
VDADPAACSLVCLAPGRAGDDDRLLCEKVYMDFAAVLTQIGVLPAIGG